MRLCVDCPICDTSPCRCDEDDPPTCATYSIEVFFYGTWEPAPGDDGGWSYDAAIRAAEDGFVGADGEPIDPEKVRVVSDETGEVVW